MNSLFNIFSACLIFLSALIPTGLVVCEKNDGSISFELKKGDSCSCEVLVVDLTEKDCCADEACHEDESVTSKCHEMQSQDCNDREIKSFELINYQQASLKKAVKLYFSSLFLVNESCPQSLVFRLHTSSDMSSRNSTASLAQQVLLFKKSVVFLV